MRRFILLAVPLVAVFCAAVTASATNESQAAALFLLIEPGAKQSSMGEAYSAVSDDATAGYYNPAGLAFQESSRRDLQAMRFQWLPGLIDGMYYDFIGYSQYVNGLGHFAFNLSSLYEVIPILNPLIPWSLIPWNRSNRFGIYDTMVSGSYGAPITDNLALGITLKGIYSKHLWLKDEKGKATGYTFALDFGTMYKPQIKGLTLSVVVHNLGPKIAYKIDYKDVDDAYPLPLNVVFGAAYIPINDEFNRITFVLDIYKPLVMRNASPVVSARQGVVRRGQRVRAD